MLKNQSKVHSQLSQYYNLQMASHMQRQIHVNSRHRCHIWFSSPFFSLVWAECPSLCTDYII